MWEADRLELEKVVNRSMINFRWNQTRLQQRSYLRSKYEMLLINIVIERLNAHSVSCNKELVVDSIPNHKHEHATKLLQAIRPPFAVSSEDHFRIAMCFKWISF